MSEEQVRLKQRAAPGAHNVRVLWITPNQRLKAPSPWAQWQKPTKVERVGGGRLEPNLIYMYVYVYIYMCVCICVYMCIYINVSIYIYVSVYKCVFINLCIYICICICKYIYICIARHRVCGCVYIYIIYLYVCM